MAARNVKIPEPSTDVKKPHSMASLYLDPINVKPNVGASEECPVMRNVMKNVEASEISNRPRFVTTLSKSSMIVADRDDVDKNIHSLEKSKDKEDSDGMSGDLAEKEANSVEKKDQSTDIVNIDDMDSDDVPIGQRLAPGITKRLKNKKDIVSTTRKQAYGKKIPANIPEVPIDNISFHHVENVEKWNFVYQRRLALESELGKYAFECNKVMSMIQEVGLMKTVTSFGKCYKILVKEFIVNVSKDCDNKRSKKFKKVYVIGRCVDLSHEIINRFLGRNEEEQDEVEVSENVICREITAK
ncbi:uncharacterized protein LOC127090138 [Lathyrus oleraceus]|uniref:uncharacterized protein LOC127090138 n=1 Tax=Pisum sativum TaxID=3888 RepID=UPI0021D2F753|nr:uncharacterized protein LOC127090138 [Pisum sativum]